MYDRISRIGFPASINRYHRNHNNLNSNHDNGNTLYNSGLAFANDVTVQPVKTLLWMSVELELSLQQPVPIPER